MKKHIKELNHPKGGRGEGTTTQDEEGGKQHQPQGERRKNSTKQGQEKGKQHHPKEVKEGNTAEEERETSFAPCEWWCVLLPSLRSSPSFHGAAFLCFLLGWRGCSFFFLRNN